MFTILKSRRSILEWAFILGICLISEVAILSAYRTKVAAKVSVRLRQSLDKEFFITDPLLGWRMTPKVSIYSKAKWDRGSRLASSDEYGFRNDVSPLPDEGSAILLGDSFVEGFFLSDNETISAHLRRKTGKFVYNFGIGGYSTDQEFIIGREALTRFKADYLVQVFFPNDLPYLETDTAFDLTKPKFVIRNGRVDFSQIGVPVKGPNIPPVFAPVFKGLPRRRIEVENSSKNDFRAYFQSEFAKNVSLLSEFILSPRITLSKLTWDPHYHFELGRQYPDKPPNYVYTHQNTMNHEWDLTFQFFDELNRLAKIRHVRYLIFFLPEIAQIRAGEDHFKLQEKFIQLCIEHGLECLEPHKAYAEAQSMRRNLYFMDDGHLTPHGAEFTSEILYDRMQAIKFRARSASR